MAGFIRTRVAAVLLVVVCGRSVPSAQDNPDLSEPAVLLPPAAVRHKALQGLVALRRADRQLLEAALADRDATIRLTAAEALLAAGPDRGAIEAVEQLAREVNTRNAALQVLATKVPLAKCRRGRSNAFRSRL